MVLGYGNFLGLSTLKYKEKLRGQTVEDLKKLEIAKIRMQFASIWSVASGACWAYFTAGGSLVVSGIGGRKWRVADRKLKMIREELASRGKQIHKVDWKDVLIPLTASAVGSAVGVGIEVGIGSLINISDVMTTDSSGSPKAITNAELQAILSDPSSAAHGFVEGVKIEPELVAHGGTLGIADGLGISGSDIPIQTLAFTPQFQSTLAELGGAQLGANASLALERVTGQLMAQEITWWIAECFEDPEWLRQAGLFLGCTRYLGTSGLDCNHCRDSITCGTYWHCCDCKDDNFDLCNKCYKGGYRCMCTTSKLRRLQFAWVGNVFHPQPREAYERSERSFRLNCNLCGTSINQGRYFQCLECNNQNFDICLKCYSEGGQCEFGKQHSLYSLLWAHVPSPAVGSPYSSSGTGGATCDICKEVVFQGAFYHCDECRTDFDKKKGIFDLCHKCYEIGGGCEDQSHVLSRYNAFNRSIQTEAPGWSFCDVPECHRPLYDEKLWYQCGICRMDDGKHKGVLAICHACYSTGTGCSDRSHPMTRFVNKSYR